VKRFWYSEAIRNARLAFPPSWPLAIFGLFLLFFEYFFWQTEERIGGTDGPAIVVLQFGVSLYGVYRVAAFHPNLRPAYREWLRTTCWRSPQPLPLGSVTLTLTDALLLLSALGLMWYRHPERSPDLPIQFFAVAYLLCMAFALLTGGPRGFGYAVTFGLGGMMMSARSPALACGVALATYLVAWIGLRRALNDLRLIETSSIERWFVKQVPAGIRAADFSSVNVGWPFGHLAPNRTVPRLPAFDGVSISLLAGWLLASFLRFADVSDNRFRPSDDVKFFVVLAFFVATLLIVGRVFVHVLNHRPPIKVFGRLVTFRWIIPSYDCAFAAPLAGLLILWGVGPWMLQKPGPPSIVGVSVLLATALLVGLVPGPTFGNWMLTSECRIVPQKPQPQGR
jgi:hypothetical protein